MITTHPMQLGMIGLADEVLPPCAAGFGGRDEKRA